MRDFRKLKVYNQSIEFVSKIYQTCKLFPSAEKYGLVQQIQKCAVSIPSNISEGCSRDSSKEFSRFIQIAIGSSFELETQLVISKNLNYLENFNLLNELTVIQKQLNSLNQSILKSPKDYRLKTKD